MDSNIQIELSVLLPGAPDERDACVTRLTSLLTAKRGINEAHILPTEAGKAVLCLHYDSDIVTLAQAQGLARTAGATLSDQYGHVVVPIRAVTAEDAAPRIEAVLRSMDGVVTASANLAAQSVRIEFERSKTSTVEVVAALYEMGYAPGVPSPSEEATTTPPRQAAVSLSWYGRNKELAWSLSAGVLLMTGWIGERWFGLAEFPAIALFALSYAFGGFDLVRHSIATACKGKLQLDIDLLMLLAALGAASLGEWAEGAFLIFLFSLAHALEHYALGRARRAIEALAELAPPTARVLRDGKERKIPIAELTVGEIIVVRPAERIPADGTVRSGRSAVNQAPITGESMPVVKTRDDEVYAGTINGDGALEVTATRVVGDRTLDRVIRLVQEAQTQKAPTQRFTERFERVFVPAVLIVSVLLMIAPPLVGWLGWAESFYRAMALLVASSPCALALGTPAAVLAGIAQAARNGVLIKGGEHLENLGTLRAIALDKTGTLTMGRPEVTDALSTDGETAEMLQVAAAVERRSQHPLAQAIVRRAESDGLAIPESGDLQSITGRGVRSLVNDQIVEIGSTRLWEGSDTLVPNKVRSAVEELQNRGRSVVVIRHGDRWLGVIGVADQPRPGVRGILDRLRELHISTIVMLTGDNRGVGDAIGKEVGVDQVRAELLPEDKVVVLQTLMKAHDRVAMVGDGVNDAPALARATVGIAMGGAGTAAALETADVALMGDDLALLPFSIGLSRRAKTIIRQNLFISLAVIVLLIMFTVSGKSGIGVAVLVHEGTTLLVIANALRLLAYQRADIGKPGQSRSQGSGATSGSTGSAS